MILDSGTMLICKREHETDPTLLSRKGHMPELKLVPYAKHWYQERTIGLHREYLAKGVNERIDLYVYIHEDRRVRIGDYVVLGNGDQFRITMVNFVIEENTNLRYTTITCQRMDENYDIDTIQA